MIKWCLPLLQGKANFICNNFNVHRLFCYRCRIKGQQPPKSIIIIIIINLLVLKIGWKGTSLFSLLGIICCVVSKMKKGKSLPPPSMNAAHVNLFFSTLSKLGLVGPRTGSWRRLLQLRTDIYLNDERRKKKVGDESWRIDKELV